MASVRKRVDGRWQVRWRTPDGRQTSQAFASEAEAKRAAKRIDAAGVLAGGAPTTAPGTCPTVDEWWARWEPGRSWADSTRRHHAYNYGKWIHRQWGRVPLDQVTVADIERWHRYMQTKGLAATSVGAVHRTLALALGGAERDGLIARNPARFARLPRRSPVPPVALDDATLARLDAAFAETAPRLRVFAKVCAQAGLRRAECCGLTWDRIDLDGLTLTIDRQLDFAATAAAGEPVWGPTKTGRSRVVPIPESLAAAFRTHRATFGLGAGGLVFTNNRGRPWARSALGRAWRAARDRLAADGHPLPAGAAGWHTLRHTYVSRLLAAGVPVVEAAAAAGHADSHTTLVTYGHIISRAEADARIRAAFDDT
jgi:integrase